MAIRVVGELALDGSGWDRTLRVAGEEVEHFADEQLSTLKSAVAEAFAVGAIEELTRATIEFGAEIERGAARLNITTQSVQELSFAAKQAGSDLSTVEAALDRLAKAKETALEGGTAGDKLVDDFSRLGITMDELKDKTPEELFRKIGETMEKMGGNSRSTTDLMAIFGRGAGQLIHVLKELREKSEELNNLHLVAGDHELARLHELEQGLGVTGVAFKKFAGEVIAGWMDIASVLGMTAVGVLGFNHEGADIATKRAEPMIAAMEKQLALQRELRADRDQHAKDLEGHAADNTAAPSAVKEGNAERSRLNTETLKLQQEHQEDGKTLDQKIADAEKNQRELQTAHDRIIKAGRAGSLEDADISNQMEHGKVNLAKLQKEHLDAVFKPAKKASNEFGLKTSDSLTRTGNFLGAGANNIVSIGEKTNHLLGQILTAVSGPKGASGTGSGHLQTTLGIAPL